MRPGGAAAACRPCHALWQPRGGRCTALTPSLPPPAGTCCCWAPSARLPWAWPVPTRCSSCPPGAQRQCAGARWRWGLHRPLRRPAAPPASLQRCAPARLNCQPAHLSLLRWPDRGAPMAPMLQRGRRRGRHRGQGCPGQRRQGDHLAGDPRRWRPLPDPGPQGAVRRQRSGQQMAGWYTADGWLVWHGLHCCRSCSGCGVQRGRWAAWGGRRWRLPHSGQQAAGALEAASERQQDSQGFVQPAAAWRLLTSQGSWVSTAWVAAAPGRQSRSAACSRGCRGDGRHRAAAVILLYAAAARSWRLPAVALGEIHQHPGCGQSATPPPSASRHMPALQQTCRPPLPASCCSCSAADADAACAVAAPCCRVMPPT